MSQPPQFSLPLERAVREVLEQVAPSAGGELAVGHHPGEPLVGAAAFRRVFDLPREPLLRRLVRVAEEQHAVARQPVPSRPSGFLVVALDGLRQVVVGDQPQVGHVDPHPEGDGGDDDQRVLLLEPFLRLPTVFVVQPGVVGEGAEAESPEPLGHRFGLPPREAVDDRGLAGALPKQLHQPVERLPFGPNRIGQVRPVEAGREELRVLHPQLRRDVASDPLGGGRGERREGDGGEPVPEDAEIPVVGAELMAPLRDAVRLVHRDQTHLDLVEETGETGRRHPLRRHIEELQPAASRLAPDFVRLVGGERAVETAGGDPPGAERVHLVLHQRDQRRDHQGQSVEGQRRKLVAERLAPAGGHQDHRILPRQEGGDRPFLQRPEAVVAEMLPKQRDRGALRRNASRGRVGFHAVGRQPSEPGRRTARPRPLAPGQPPAAGTADTGWGLPSGAGLGGGPSVALVPAPTERRSAPVPRGRARREGASRRGYRGRGAPGAGVRNPRPGGVPPRRRVRFAALPDFVVEPVVRAR